MATVSEMFVTIGADTAELDQATRRMQSDLRSVGSSVSALASDMDTSTSDMRRQWSQMSTEMRAAVQRNNAALAPFREQQREIQYEFFQMAEGMSEYEGSTDEFMSSLTELGNRNRQVNDQMIANNNMARMGFIQGIATMLAASTQSSKIAANFTRMRNPLYRVNNGLLAVTGGLERMAARGQPAVMALRMLGPTASMKALNDMTRLITAGLMRFQMVAMAGAVAAGLLFAGLNSAAAESVPGYKKSMEEMGAAMRQAFQPMVEVFAAIMMKIAEFVTWIANLAIKFNEAHPVMAKVIQGFLMLIPILILLLSPLAIGVGLVNGIAAAFSSVWMLIAPLVTGLGAMMGTVLLVAGVLVVAGVAIWALWTKCKAFKDGVITVWNTIKQATVTAWNYVLNSVLKPVWNAIVKFGQDIFGKFQAFWKQHGDNILKIGKAIWTAIKVVVVTIVTAIAAVLNVLWNVIKSVVQAVWGNIKGIISGILDIIMGVVGAFVSLFTGDWKSLGESLKQIWSGIWKVVENVIRGAVNIVLGIVRGLGNAFGGIFKSIGNAFYNAGKGFMDMLIKGIKSMISKVTSMISSVAGKIRDFLPFSPAKTGPLSDLDKLDFGGPIADSMKSAIPKVQSLMNSLVAMPGISANASFSGANNGQAIVINMDGRQVAKGVLPAMVSEIKQKTGIRFN